MLRVENLNQAFGKHKVLSRISFSLNAGEGMMIQGANGAGKTTLLKVLAGLVKAKSGELTIPASPSLFLPSSFFFHDLTLRENLKFYARLYQTETSRLDHLISVFRLSSFLNREFGVLSLGQKIRGGLARTFLTKTSLYLLDEPLTGLDDESSASLVDFLGALKKEKGSFLVASHDTQRFDGIIDHRLILEKKS